MLDCEVNDRISNHSVPEHLNDLEKQRDREGKDMHGICFVKNLQENKCLEIILGIASYLLHHNLKLSTTF